MSREPQPCNPIFNPAKQCYLDFIVFSSTDVNGANSAQSSHLGLAEPNQTAQKHTSTFITIDNIIAQKAINGQKTIIVYIRLSSQNI